MTTGLYGGAFDPPHNGHVALARAGRERFGLDRLVVLVNDHPGHKGVALDGTTRLELARAAFPDDDVRLDPYPRTVDMLRASGWDDPLFLIGADQFADFLRWKDFEEVLERTRLGVAARPGFSSERLAEVLAGLRRPERVELFELEPIPIASRDLRARAAAGEPLDGLVPPAVAAIIRERGLYRPEASLHFGGSPKGTDRT
jgi:nicotinate-nucleotide adenylyltransferase